MTGNLVNDIHVNLTIWTAAKMSYLSHSCLNSCHKWQLLRHHLLGVRDVLQILKKGLERGPKRFVVIGISGVVKWICAVTVIGTMSAASVVGLIEPRTDLTALQPSTTDVNSRKQQQQLEAAARKAHEAAASGTRRLKLRATDSISEIPHFKRGFVWDRSSVSPLLSPSALATETAPPLASPPLHLINDPTIKSTLHAMHDFICVETPFNVDRFEAMLYDHPNQPFVRSVMNSLRNGFWPFDEGNWKDDCEEVIQNYSMKEGDAEAIRAFRDDEIQAGRWSEPLPLKELLPGMKVSPIFVVWQRGKPRVVNDHFTSGLNDCIPRFEAKGAL